jgi:hypothetical protein
VDNIVREIRGPNKPILVQNHEALNEILHLSDVSRPEVSLH